MNFRALLSLCHVIHLIYWFLDIWALGLNNNWFVSLLCFWNHWSVHISSCYCMVLISFEKGCSKCHYEWKNWEHQKKLCDACMILRTATIWTMSQYKNINDGAHIFSSLKTVKNFREVNYLKWIGELMGKVIIRFLFSWSHWKIVMLTVI